MNTETGPETIQRVLGAYELGAKLKRLRMKKKVSLADLSQHTGLSASMISQLENGKMFPTLPTLARIAMVFDVGLGIFFGGEPAEKLFSIVRQKERMRFPERADAAEPAYFFECLAYAAQGKGFQAYLAEFPPSQSPAGSDHFHEGLEFLFILEGRLRLRFNGQDHELDRGDSALMDSSAPHSYRGMGKENTRAVVITVPPRL